MLPTPRSRRFLRFGLSYVEVLVASSILLLLFGAISMIYHSSSQVWRKVDHRTSLLRELQVAVRFIERGVEVSHPFGLARAEKALAYLSAEDGDNKISLDAQGKPRWQKFFIVFVDEDGRLRRRELPLTPPNSKPPTFQDEFGVTLQAYLDSQGAESGDRHLTHSGTITRFALENAGHYGSLFELIIEAEQMKNSTEKERLEIRTKISVRN